MREHERTRTVEFHSHCRFCRSVAVSQCRSIASHRPSPHFDWWTPPQDGVAGAGAGGTRWWRMVSLQCKAPLHQARCSRDPSLPFSLETPGFHLGQAAQSKTPFESPLRLIEPPLTATQENLHVAQPQRAGVAATRMRDIPSLQP